MNWAPFPWGKYFFPPLNMRSKHRKFNRTCSFISEVMRLLWRTVQNPVIHSTVFLELPSSEGFTPAILMEYSFICCHSRVYLQTSSWWLESFGCVLCTRSLPVLFSVMFWLIIWRALMLLLSVYSSHASSSVMQHLWRKS